MNDGNDLKPQDVVYGGKLESKDIFPEYKHLFTEKALEVLNRPLAISQCERPYPHVLDESGKPSLNKIEYISWVVDEANIPRVVGEIAIIINDLAEKENITKFLTRLATIKLDPLSHSDRYVVFSFPMLTPAGSAVMDQYKTAELAKKQLI